MHARLVDGIQDVFACLQGETEIGPETSIYAIANYTALPPVHAALDQLADAKSASQAHDIHDAHADDEAVDTAEIVGVCVNRIAPAEPCAPSSSAPVRIIHVLPDLLNLYGDGGNVRILANRLRWRDIPVEVQKVCYGEPLELDDADLVFIGGSPDREQRLASEVLGDVRDELAAYIDAGGPVLAICGGYQMLGRTWLLDGEEVPGLAILPMETRRPGTSADRLVDNIALDSSLATLPVIGYENHAGRTVLDSSATPFGRVVSHTGRGNTDETGPGQGVDGILHQNVVGTYLHGPLLAKNPQVADWLLERALKRWAARTKNVPVELQPLDDAVEEAANAFMAQQIIR